MKERPILVAVIGYIIGIIMGLYFNFSIVLFYIIIAVIFSIYNNFIQYKKNKKFKLISVKRYFKYLKIIFNQKTIYIILISSIISNTVVIFQNQKYEKMYKELSKHQELNLIGVVISNKEEGKYYNQYTIETKYNNQKIKLYIKIKNKEDKNLKYGDQINLEGTYIKPQEQRNYKGFDYCKYLRQKKIYGTIKCQKINLQSKNKGKILLKKSNDISTKVKNEVRKLIDKDKSEIILGLILGEKSNIDEEIQENFRNASMAHILAISGMHITYVLIGINILFKKKLGKRKTNIISIVILVIYMFITNFSASITRAGIMGILVLVSKLIYRKNDMWTSIFVSLLIILIYNPFMINDFGLQLSYGGTIGIIGFNKTILNYLNNIKIKKLKYKITANSKKILEKIKQIISISLSVQIFIIPIILYKLNTINPYFLLSNLLVSVVIGFIIIISFLFIITILINTQLARILTSIIEICIGILIYISKIGELPFSKIYVPTPKIQNILAYYFIIYIIKIICDTYYAKNPNKSQIRIKNLIALSKFRFYQNKKKVVKNLIIVLIIIIFINFIPNKLKIYFIDVGQGDSTLIVTPKNKTILIDGGGSETSDFDVGKNTLLPYILDRGLNKIDTIIISHFDKDHCRTDC